MNVIITGSTQGIGLGMAKEFLKRDHNVLINGRTEDKCLLIAKALREQFPSRNILHFSCDVSDYAKVKAMFQYGLDQWNSVDIWVNNAGMDQKKVRPWEMDPESMDQIIGVNIKGVVNGTRAASAAMMNEGGFIYNMEGYGSNDMMGSFMSFYGMTKRALTYFTISAAKEAEGTALKIGRLSPGMVVTDLLLGSLPDEREKRKKSARLFHILADRVEDVTPFLVNSMLKNKKNNAHIAWLTGFKSIQTIYAAAYCTAQTAGIGNLVQDI